MRQDFFEEIYELYYAQSQMTLQECLGAAQESCASIAVRAVSGASLGAKRSKISPSRPTKNFVKFHLIFLVPNTPGAAFLSWVKSECASLPLTSMRACIGKLTP